MIICINKPWKSLNLEQTMNLQLEHANTQEIHNMLRVFCVARLPLLVVMRREGWCAGNPTHLQPNLLPAILAPQSATGQAKSPTNSP